MPFSFVESVFSLWQMYSPDTEAAASATVTAVEAAASRREHQLEEELQRAHAQVT